MNRNKINIAVLISGRGSNLQALIDACQRDNFPARISIVISNVSDAYGLERAQKAGILTHVVSHNAYPDKTKFEQELINQLNKHDIDLVCLAGFMQILSSHFIDNVGSDRLINIHPSLLPNYKGLNTHQRAIDDGQTKAGCTVHHVTADVDSGKKILQKQVRILKKDTAETLAEKVLEQEHIIYPAAVETLAKAILGK